MDLEELKEKTGWSCRRRVLREGLEEALALMAACRVTRAYYRAEAKRRFGVDFFPAAATELGSGQPFLRFFQTDREGRERGVLSVELQARR
jgi:hypothetical protein